MNTSLNRIEPKKETGAAITAEESQQRLELLYDVAQRASSFSEVAGLLEEIMSVIQHLLNASASSLLLIDQQNQGLYFQTAGGPAASTLRRMKLDPDSGITGWVACNGRALIANDVSRDKRFNKDVDAVSGFITKSILAVPLFRGKEIIGVLEVLNKSDETDFTQRDLAVLTGFAATEAMMLLVSMAATALNNVKLHQAMLDDYKSTIEALVTAADGKDPYASGHSRRVSEYVLLAASSLNIPPQELQVLEFGALLHDIGKIGIDDGILRQSRPLTDEEWYIIRKHPLRGANIVGEIPFLREARDIILSHHERYDGKGYPQGLKGESIPIGARLIAVADAFDTMTTEHSYRPALSIEEALNELNEGIGTQFCPTATSAFISGFKKRQDKQAAEEAEKAAAAESSGPPEDEADDKGADEGNEANEPAETAETPEIKETEKPEIYKGDVHLTIQSNDFEQIKRFKDGLKKIKDLKLVLDSWSEEEGTVVTVSLKEPMALSTVLREAGEVENVTRKGKKVEVVLKAVNQQVNSDT